MIKTILASQSPRRKRLLEQIGITFSVFPTHVDEDIDPHMIKEQQPVELALRKAHACALNHSGNVFIIASDTMVWKNNQLLDKPFTYEEAFKSLSELSGSTHEVISGVALLVKKDEDLQEISFFEKTLVTFRDLDRNEIELYIETGSPFDKAGGYGIQDDWGTLFVSRIEGDYNNVVGFPLTRFYQEVKQHFPSLLPFPNSRSKII